MKQHFESVGKDGLSNSWITSWRKMYLELYPDKFQMVRTIKVKHANTMRKYV